MNSSTKFVKEYIDLRGHLRFVTEQNQIKIEIRHKFSFLRANIRL